MSKRKITKAQKKLKKAIIEKWIPEKTGRELKKNFMKLAASASGVIACVETLFYGFPFLSVGVLGVSGIGIAKVGCSFENNAEQRLATSDFSVAMALCRMDRKMSKLFNSYADSKNAKGKEAFKTEMESVYEDFKVLEGFYEVIQGGVKGYSERKFVFEMVAANTNENVVTPAVTFNDVANGTVKYPQKNLRDTPSFGI